MKHYILYHTDMDGYASGAIVRQYLKENCRAEERVLMPVNYDRPFPSPDLEQGDTVWLLDYTPQPPQVMIDLIDLIVRRGAVMHWVDHHKTAIEADYGKHNTPIRHLARDAAGGALPANPPSNTVTMNALLLVGQAGCELTWQYCFPGQPMPRAIYLIGRHDVWDNASPIWDSLIEPFQLWCKVGLGDPGDSRFDDSWWAALRCKLDIHACVEKGELLRKYQQRNDRAYLKPYACEAEFHYPTDSYPADCERAWHRSAPCVAVNGGARNSQAFEGFYDPSRHDLMVIYTRIPDGRWSFSLYSTKPEVDCGAICKKFGGGGHKGAAGFQLPYHLLDQTLRLLSPITKTKG